MTAHRAPLRSILSVDDSEADQYLNELVIHEYDPDIEVHFAYDGAEALDALTRLEEAPDVILLDINMPGMNGFEFLERYQHVYAGGRSPVVVMLSSSLHDEDRRRALGYDPVKGFLGKPLGPDWADLVARLTDG